MKTKIMKTYTIPTVQIEYFRPLSVLCASGDPVSEFGGGTSSGDAGGARARRSVF